MRVKCLFVAIALRFEIIGRNQIFYAIFKNRYLKWNIENVPTDIFLQNAKSMYVYNLSVIFLNRYKTYFQFCNLNFCNSSKH